MRERPILMSAPMVRALLAGTKTQTRRPVKKVLLAGSIARNGSVLAEDALIDTDHGETHISTIQADCRRDGYSQLCPYGKPGDKLWVRESFQPLLDEKLGAEPLPGEYDYKTGRGYCVSYPATDGVQEFYNMGSDEAFCSHITPSIHMPRWASRITLEIVEVRVQRLQDISEEDAFAEGVAPARTYLSDNCGPNVAAYSTLWESINGPGSWDANPWVWALTFNLEAPCK